VTFTLTLAQVDTVVFTNVEQVLTNPSLSAHEYVILIQTKDRTGVIQFNLVHNIPLQFVFPRWSLPHPECNSKYWRVVGTLVPFESLHSSVDHANI
jgi:hypothetical protein